MVKNHYVWNCYGSISKKNVSIQNHFASINLAKISLFLFFADKLCPGNCSNAGNCDTSTGVCLCNPGRNGVDCSSKFSISIFNLTEFEIIVSMFLFSKEFDCPSIPVLGVCSNQGSCDDTTGTCTCDEGFQGFQCLGK